MRQFALLATGLFAGTLFAADDKKDAEAIVGTWQVEKFQSGNEETDKGFASSLKMTVTFDKDGKMVRLTTRADGKPLLDKPEKPKPVTFKLDPSKKPKEIEIGSETAGDIAGIYELNGDTLNVCHAVVGSTTRPTEFKGEKGKSLLMVLKRVKDK